MQSMPCITYVKWKLQANTVSPQAFNYLLGHRQGSAHHFSLVKCQAYKRSINFPCVITNSWDDFLSQLRFTPHFLAAATLSVTNCSNSLQASRSVLSPPLSAINRSPSTNRTVISRSISSSSFFSSASLSFATLASMSSYSTLSLSILSSALSLSALVQASPLSSFPVKSLTISRKGLEFPHLQYFSVRVGPTAGLSTIPPCFFLKYSLV
mmetsp:Transcript_15714/g.32194  ORF Transcript_15714/g.32194 Transcript_15714/m.32194 type:complete len:210 (+) Transcript_15714:80-709(+)